MPGRGAEQVAGERAVAQALTSISVPEPTVSDLLRKARCTMVAPSFEAHAASAGSGKRTCARCICTGEIIACPAAYGLFDPGAHNGRRLSQLVRQTRREMTYRLLKPRRKLSADVSSFSRATARVVT
jgi:hypothetical protein